MVAASLAKAEAEIDRLYKRIMGQTQMLFETKKARDELEQQLVAVATRERGKDLAQGAPGYGGESGAASAAYLLMQRYRDLLEQENAAKSGSQGRSNEDGTKRIHPSAASRSGTSGNIPLSPGRSATRPSSRAIESGMAYLRRKEASRAEERERITKRAALIQRQLLRGIDDLAREVSAAKEAKKAIILHVQERRKADSTYHQVAVDMHVTTERVRAANRRVVGMRNNVAALRAAKESLQQEVAQLLKDTRKLEREFAQAGNADGSLVALQAVQGIAQLAGVPLLNPYAEERKRQDIAKKKAMDRKKLEDEAERLAQEAKNNPLTGGAIGGGAGSGVFLTQYPLHMDGGRYMSDQPLDSDEEGSGGESEAGPAAPQMMTRGRRTGSRGGLGSRQAPLESQAGLTASRTDVGYDLESSDSAESSDTDDMEYRKRRRRMSSSRPGSRGLGGALPGGEEVDERLGYSIVQAPVVPSIGGGPGMEMEYFGDEGGSLVSIPDGSVVSLVPSQSAVFGAGSPSTPTSRGGSRRRRRGSRGSSRYGRRNSGGTGGLPPVRGTHRRGGRGSRQGARHQRDDGVVRVLAGSSSLLSIGGKPPGIGGGGSAVGGGTTSSVRRRPSVGRLLGASGVVGTRSVGALPQGGGSTRKVPLGSINATGSTSFGMAGATSRATLGSRQGRAGKGGAAVWAATRAPYSTGGGHGGGEAPGLNPDGSTRRPGKDLYHEDDEELQRAALRQQALGDDQLLPFEREKEKISRRKRRLLRIERQEQRTQQDKARRRGSVLELAGLAPVQSQSRLGRRNSTSKGGRRSSVASKKQKSRAQLRDEKRKAMKFALSIQVQTLAEELGQGVNTAAVGEGATHSVLSSLPTIFGGIREAPADTRSTEDKEAWMAFESQLKQHQTEQSKVDTWKGIAGLVDAAAKGKDTSEDDQGGSGPGGASAFMRMLEQRALEAERRAAAEQSWRDAQSQHLQWELDGLENRRHEIHMATAVLGMIQQQTDSKDLDQTVQQIEGKEAEVLGAMEAAQAIAGETSALEAERASLLEEVAAKRREVAALSLPGGSVYKRQQLQQIADLQRERREEAEAEYAGVNSLLEDLLEKLRDGFGAVDADVEEQLVLQARSRAAGESLHAPHAVRAGYPQPLSDAPDGVHGLVMTSEADAWGLSGAHSGGTTPKAMGQAASVVAGGSFAGHRTAGKGQMHGVGTSQPMHRSMTRKVSLLQLTHQVSQVTRQASMRRSPSFARGLSSRASVTGSAMGRRKSSRVASSSGGRSPMNVRSGSRRGSPLRNRSVASPFDGASSPSTASHGFRFDGAVDTKGAKSTTMRHADTSQGLSASGRKNSGRDPRRLVVAASLGSSDGDDAVVAAATADLGIGAGSFHGGGGLDGAHNEEGGVTAGSRPRRKSVGGALATRRRRLSLDSQLGGRQSLLAIEEGEEAEAEDEGAAGASEAAQGEEAETGGGRKAGPKRHNGGGGRRQRRRSIGAPGARGRLSMLDTGGLTPRTKGGFGPRSDGKGEDEQSISKGSRQRQYRRKSAIEKAVLESTKAGGAPGGLLGLGLQITADQHDHHSPSPKQGAARGRRGGRGPGSARGGKMSPGGGLDLDDEAVGLAAAVGEHASMEDSSEQYLTEESEAGDGDDGASTDSAQTVNSGGASGLAGVFQPDMLDLAQSKGVEPKTLRAWLGQMESLLTEVTTMETLVNQRKAVGSGSRTTGMY